MEYRVMHGDHLAFTLLREVRAGIPLKGYDVE